MATVTKCTSCYTVLKSTDIRKQCAVCRATANELVGKRVWSSVDRVDEYTKELCILYTTDRQNIDASNRVYSNNSQVERKYVTGSLWLATRAAKEIEMQELEQATITK